MAATLLLLIAPPSKAARVVKEGDRLYIVDRMGDRWDVTQAETVGFDPHGFQYGIGKNAFQTLDDSDLGDDSGLTHPRTRVIGIADESGAHAYSVPKLSRHEIANTHLGKTPIAAGY